MNKGQQSLSYLKPILIIITVLCPIITNHDMVTDEV